MKVINKDKIVIKIGNSNLVIDKITPPKYFIKEHELTEYDVRNIQSEVARGNIPYQLLNYIGIYDQNGQKFIFHPDGSLQNTPFGYDIMSKMVLSILKERRKKS